MRTTRASPAAPPTTPPAMVPGGAVESSLSESSLDAVAVAMSLEVPVAPWSAAPAIPIPSLSSEL